MSNEPLILIVDDDVELGEMLEVVLNRGGYRSHVANTGAEALAWLKNNQPDLVLLDIMMPDTNGFTILRELRASEFNGAERLTEVKHSAMPVVMITAFADDKTETESTRAGAHSLLRKPLEPGALLEHIKELLNPLE